MHLTREPQMNDEPRRRRWDMSRILWGLLPVAIFFVLLFLIYRFGRWR